MLASTARAGRTERTEELFAARPNAAYTAAERRYSAAIQARVNDLLEGRLNRLVLLRRYHEEDRVAVMRGPRELDCRELRLPVVEKLLTSTLVFVRNDSPGGPVCQEEESDRLVETQQFSTRYPHIVIERVDAFAVAGHRPVYTEWRLRRIQNQRAETQINRWLDAATLGLTLFKAFSGSA